MEVKELTNVEAVKLALWNDDPYGDGIRLKAVREPSVERLAALLFVATGQRTIDNVEQAYIDRGLAIAKNKKLVTAAVRNGII